MDALARDADTAPGTETKAGAEANSLGAPALMQWVKRHLIFVLTVLVPTLVASIYYGLIATGVYISESRFVVRSPQQKVQSSLFSDLLQGTGFARSQDDTYSVRDFILSRDALKELDEKVGIRKSYASRAVDIFNRFPGLRWDDSFERFYLYYGKHVDVDYDSASSITTLTVRAFTAQNAYNINRALLDMSERLVNKLNDRSREDLIRFAEADVKVATDRVREASLAMLAYRSKQAVYAPDQQAQIQLEGVAKIEEDLISTEAQLAQLKKISPNNPQIAGLTSRAEILRKAVMAEAGKVTSANGSLSARAPEFERLAVDTTTADQQLGTAIAELQTARSDAARQQLYLERLVQPNLPDHAMEPRRIRSVFTVFLLGLISWGVVSLLLASIREHGD
jgi:capsular polysaccharide transport system permease protein